MSKKTLLYMVGVSLLTIVAYERVRSNGTAAAATTRMRRAA